MEKRKLRVNITDKHRCKTSQWNISKVNSTVKDHVLWSSGIYPRDVIMIWHLGFPGSSAGKESTCNAGDPRVDFWVRKFPWRRDRLSTPVFLGFPGGSDGRESTCSTGNLGSIPGLGRSPGGGHGNQLQYSCLENSMDRGAWRATVHGVSKSQAQLSD